MRIKLTQESLMFFRKDKKMPQKKKLKSTPLTSPNSRRSSDFQIDKIITYGYTHTPVVKLSKPRNITTPTYRLIDEMDGEVDDEEIFGESSGEEDTSDEFYETIHKDFVFPFEHQLVDLRVKEDKKRKGKRKKKLFTFG